MLFLRPVLFVLVWTLIFIPHSRGEDEIPAKVSSPPEAFFQIVDSKHRDAARAFYTKYVDVDGMPVVASGEVDDQALQRTWSIVRQMLAGRPDVVRSMIANEMYLIIIGKDQVYTDMPEYRLHPDPDYVNERVRGTGGRPTSFGEENLLSLPIDRYDDESIAVHEFAHTIDGALRSMDPDWESKKKATYQHAISKKRYHNAYAASNAGEYWAEIVQAYFDCDRANNWNHNHIVTREQLRDYDPEGYELVRQTLRLKPNQDWRYSWLQPLPNVIPPPRKFGIDSYYTKFTYAREFPIVARAASDVALLKANDTIRKMFAYRHDVLKTLINSGTKLVVLAEDEQLSDLPELNGVTASDVDLLSRTFDYTPRERLIVVDERNIISDPSEAEIGPNQVIQGLAKAIYEATGDREVDPNWEDRGQAVQQYELHVKRLDVEFGDRLRGLYLQAIEEGKWAGTTAAVDPASYWAKGVLCYFEAVGQDAAPSDAPFPIRNREELEEYDPALYGLVHEVFAYAGHVDWRYQALLDELPRQ